MINVNDDSVRIADVVARLDVMMQREREIDTPRRDYLELNPRADVDASCRAAMISWLRQVQGTLSLNPEPVRVASSLLDRFLGSGSGASGRVLESKREFQLAAITCFYTAVKTTEPIAVGTDFLLRICRGTYREGEIEAMEMEIMVALGWRVVTHTSMDFAAHLLEIVSDRVSDFVRESLMESCRKHADHAMTDVNFLSCRPSVVGTVCLASALAECSLVTSSSEKRAIWVRLSGLCNFDPALQEEPEVRDLLASHVSPCKPSIGSKLVTP